MIQMIILLGLILLIIFYENDLERVSDRFYSGQIEEYKYTKEDSEQVNDIHWISKFPQNATTQHWTDSISEFQVGCTIQELIPDVKNWQDEMRDDLSFYLTPVVLERVINRINEIIEEKTDFKLIKLLNK